MGCCQSTNNLPQSPHLDKDTTFTKSRNKSPPPCEEETVKEVLSETPLPKNLSPKYPSKNAIFKIQEADHNVVKKPTFVNPLDGSENASEISGSVSATTFNEEEVEFRRSSPAAARNRSFSGDARKERVVGKSPGRGPVNSPGRVRSVPARGGEGSGPRSRSPSSQVVASGCRSGIGVGRSPSAKKTGKSPNRARPELGEKTGKSPSRVRSNPNEKNLNSLSRVGSDRALSSRVGSDRNGMIPGRVGSDLNERDWPGLPPTVGNESLENPLVSLECFIFL